MEMQASNYKENKLRWYPQQPQRFIFTNLSEACCETKRWKHFEPVGTWPGPAPKIPQTFSGTFSATCSGTRWTWPGSAPKPPGTFSGTFSGTLLNLTWLCTKASPHLLRNPVEPDLSLHQILDLLGNLRNLLRNLVETWPGACTSAPELFWAEDPVSLRCWGQTADLCADPCWTKSVEVQDTRSWKIDWE